MPSGDITALGVAIGLVTASAGAVVTLIASGYRRRAREPKLELQAVDELYFTTVASKPAAYARLALSNHPKSDAADTVRVRIEAVQTGSGEDVGFLREWQLAWANEDRGDPNVPPTPKSVAPGSSKQVDLAHLNPVAPGRAIVDVRPQPGDNHGNRLDKGTYLFKIMVDADNAPTRRYAIELEHSGEPWDGDESTAADRLRVAGVRRL